MAAAGLLVLLALLAGALLLRREGRLRFAGLGDAGRGIGARVCRAHTRPCSRWRRRDEARAAAPLGFHNPVFYAADSAEAVRGARGRGCATSSRSGSLTLRSRSSRPRSRTKGAPAAATSLIRCLTKRRPRPERPRDRPVAPRPQPHPGGIAGPAGSPTFCWPSPIKRFFAPAVSVDTSRISCACLPLPGRSWEGQVGW